ncbi:MAG: biotin transporter BioY [Bacilli bacterium]|nr:biotin transporter BioY [Bacilli bacterium]
MEKKRINLKKYVLIAVLAALISVISPLSIKVLTIPYSLSIFIIALVSLAFPPIYSIVAVLIYIALGMLGVPVFAGFNGGIGVIAGITGGYIIGYLPFTLLLSYANYYFKDKIWLQIIMIICGLICCYATGLMWFIMQTDNTFSYAFMATVAPYVLPDLIKIGIAFAIAYQLRTRLPFLKNMYEKK